MAQTVDKEKLNEVNFEAEVRCAVPVCPHPGRWVWYLDCGATGQPLCDRHNDAMAQEVTVRIKEECTCIRFEHVHLVSELKNRKL